MSWLYSRALVEEYLEACSSVGKPSAPSSSIPMPQAYLSPDKMTAYSRLSRFGMTFAPLMDGHGMDLLTWYLAAFHVKTSAPPAEEPELLANALVSGKSLPELLARYDRDLHLWKTPQLSLFGDSMLFSVTWPRSGTMRNGVCWERTTAERRITENESGYWPTPRANKWGLPDSHGSTEAFRIFPTPQSRDWKGRSQRGSDPENADCLPNVVGGGSLNPTWVEYLMGWPKEWTCLESISHVQYLQWLMGRGCSYGKEADTEKILRMLRTGNAAEGLSRAIGRPVDISEAAILLAIMCEYKDRLDQARIFMACAETLENELRGMWIPEAITSSPHKSSHIRQWIGEHPDAMQALSRFLAYYGAEAWLDGSWENAEPRVGQGIKARVDRLKAIGNGQVPIVAATAWNILMERIR